MSEGFFDQLYNNYKVICKYHGDQLTWFNFLLTIITFKI